MKCPYCKCAMNEVSRDEYQTCIQIILECEECARTVLAEFEFAGFYDEEDNEIDEVTDDIRGSL